MQPSAFKAAYSDWKLIKTRGVVQVVMEVPLADADAAYKVLGGMPDAAREQWFGVAALKLAQTEKEKAIPAKPQPNTAPAGAKRDWRELQPQQQAGIRCGEPTFQAFLKEMFQGTWREFEDAAQVVRSLCDVHSRVELGTNHKARVLWHQLDSEYQAWLAKERVGA